MIEGQDQVARAAGRLRRPGPQGGLLQAWLLGIIAFAVILFLLVQARFILISLVIAIILFSLTSDVIRWVGGARIGRLRIPPVAASIVALGIIAGFLFALAGLFLSQANTVVTTVAQYTDPAQRAVAELFSWMGEDVEAAVLLSMQQFRVADYLRTLAGQASGILSGVVLIVLFVGFLFAERLFFSAKLTRLFGDEVGARRAEEVIASIVHRVNRYLLVKALVSFVTGALAWAAMSLFGLDLALAVGILTFVLNFIPNVGSIVATIIASLVGYVQTSDTVLALGLLAVLTAVQFTVGMVLDPLLLGRALRLSSLGIIVSLAFWAAVWGVAGMFLAVPIMVAVMIVCAHVEGLRPVAVLLSRDGVPDTRRSFDGPASVRPEARA